MSAPPIGMMIKTPMTKANRAMAQNNVPDCASQNQTTSAIISNPSSAFSACCPGKTMGAPLMMPWSLAKAMIDPVNVIAPMAVPMLISIRLATPILPGVPMP